MIDEPILQACAVPYRDGPGGLEICLVTSLIKGRWGFPKGVIDPGETPHTTALKEAAEEAGLEGRIEGAALGEYIYFKWNRRLVVTGFIMRVTSCRETWFESGLRRRRWWSPPEAGRRLSTQGQRNLLDAAIERLARPAGGGDPMA